MLRSIGATFGGVAIAVAMALIFESIGQILFPSGAVPQADDAAAMADYIAKVEPPALVWVVLTWSVCATAGAFIAMRIGGGDKLPVFLTAAFLLFVVIMTLINIPHPLWMNLASVPVVLLGTATGAQLAHRRASALDS